MRRELPTTISVCYTADKVLASCTSLEEATDVHSRPIWFRSRALLPHRAVPLSFLPDSLAPVPDHFTPHGHPARWRGSGRRFVTWLESIQALEVAPVSG
jgi:hypothetical protein